MPKRGREESAEAAGGVRKAPKHVRDEKVINKIARELDVHSGQVGRAVVLLDEGNTIPFIARYRKEATGEMSDTQLRNLGALLHTADELATKITSALKSLGGQGVLTKDLEQRIRNAETAIVLEDICLPFKRSRETKASIARQKGLGKLAQDLLTGAFKEKSVEQYVLSGAVTSVNEAVEGSMAIIAEQAAEVTQTRDHARLCIRNRGILNTEAVDISTKKTMDKEGAREGQKAQTSVWKGKGPVLSKSARDPLTYQTFFGFQAQVNRLEPHQVLAIKRGEHLKFLSKKFTWNTSSAGSMSRKNLAHHHLPSNCEELVNKAISEGIKSKLKPSIEREVWSQLVKASEHEAIQSFSRNLKNLLLQPAMPGIIAMGIDPGFRSGCKVAVCSPVGAVLDTMVIFPHPPANQRREASNLILESVKKYGVDAIAIGNGTASRETESFISNILSGGKTGWCIVSECGASTYSASAVAATEFPDMDVTLRGAVSIARRLQDPLAEYVKVDPHHLGVGLYQHDLKAGILLEDLKGVVECVVNEVGVDINSASAQLLAYVAGVSKPVSVRIVEHRESKGKYTRREQLKNIKGFGPKAYTQSAGFFRIKDSKNALDRTPVHPESYHVVEELCRILIGTTMDDHQITRKTLKDIRDALCNVKEGRGKWKTESLAQKLKVGVPTLKDIVNALLAPGRDIRGKPVNSMLRTTAVGSLDTLVKGQHLDGVVRNVVAFGAFVDVGVGKDGLIHRSKLGKRCEPHEVVSVGDRVVTQVVDVDLEGSKLKLSLVSVASEMGGSA